MRIYCLKSGRLSDQLCQITLKDRSVMSLFQNQLTYGSDIVVIQISSSDSTIRKRKFNNLITFSSPPLY